LYSWKKVQDQDKLWWFNDSANSNQVKTLEDAFLSWELKLNSVLDAIPPAYRQYSNKTTKNKNLARYVFGY